MDQTIIDMLFLPFFLFVFANVVVSLFFIRVLRVVLYFVLCRIDESERLNALFCKCAARWYKTPVWCGFNSRGFSVWNKNHKQSPYHFSQREEGDNWYRKTVIPREWYLFRLFDK